MHPARLAPGRRDARPPEVGEMARNLRLADPGDLHEITDADFPVANEIEQAEPGGIGESAEEKIDGERLVVFRHSGKHYIWLDRYEQAA